MPQDQVNISQEARRAYVADRFWESILDGKTLSDADIDILYLSFTRPDYLLDLDVQL